MTKRKKIVLGLTASFIAIAFGLMVAEVVFRSMPYRQYEFHNTSRWFKLNWLRIHAGRKSMFDYAIDEFDEQYGWMMKPNLRHQSMGDYSVNSNSGRMRGLEEADTSAINILAIGDSFTFGECVEDTCTIAAYLQAMTGGKAKVLNMGVHGWGFDQMLLRLKNEGARYKPRVVIVGCYTDDLQRNRMVFRDYAKPWFSLKNDSLVLNGVPVPPPDKTLAEFHSRFLDYAALKISYLTEDENPDCNTLLSEKILVEIIRECRRIHAVPLFFYLPQKNECIDNAPLPCILFKDVVKKENVEWIDPTDSIYTAIRHLPTPQDEFACHYSPRINKIIARRLLPSVMAAIGN